MIAMQSGDTTTIINTSKQILENCVGEISNIKVDKLPLFDVEFLFLNIRARSIGEQVTLRYKCNHQVPDANTGSPKTCGVISEYSVNLLDIKPTFGEGHNKFIQLSDTVGITLRYPTFNAFQKITRKDLPADEAFTFLVDCIESINDTEAVVYTKDVPKEEVIDFVNSMNHEQIAKMDHFFDTMPKIQTTVAFKCPACSTEEQIVVEGLDSFFV